MQEDLKKEVGIIRRFNRYYTNVLGLLDRHILQSDLSLSEARVLHEIQTMEDCTPQKLVHALSMDSGYLSRILKKFAKWGLVDKRKSPEDGRSYFLRVTGAGEEKMAELNARSDEQILGLITPLSREDRSRLVRDMASIERLLTANTGAALEDISIRHRIKPGDVGYLTYLHGWMYQQEYHYTTAFEGYVAKSFFDFLQHYDPARDRLWIAEHNQEIVGSIGIVGHGDRAQLRWFLVHPGYRGIGLGKRLLREAIAFCREGGYRTVVLGTTDDLRKAIGMYTAEGFVKVSEKENHSWSDHLMELEFELTLKQPD